MTARHLPALLAVVLSTGLVLAGPAAHADRVVTDDAASDALLVSFGESREDPEFSTVPAPDQTSVDVTRTVVQHRTDRLRVTVRFRDLQLNRRAFHFTSLRVLTPATTYTVDVENLTGRGGAAELRRGSRTVECRGLRSSMDEVTDRVVLSVPTACLSAPRWVRIGVAAIEVDSDLTPEPSGEMQVFADDGHRAGRISENSIAKGPRVFAG